MEVGTFYTLKSAEFQSYGSMVHLQEIESKYGFQDFLFEELEEYELELYESNYENWLQGVLEKGIEDVEADRVKTLSVSEARKKEIVFDEECPETTPERALRFKRVNPPRNLKRA